MRLSLHSKEGLGKKYVDNERLWLKTEDMVRRAMTNGGVPFVEVANEAAFYGPKIDVQIWSAIGQGVLAGHQPGGLCPTGAFQPGVIRIKKGSRKRRCASTAPRSARTSASSGSCSNTTPAISRSGSRPSTCASSRSPTRKTNMRMASSASCAS